MNDPLLADLVRKGEADPDVVGILLQGSRSAGTHDEESDYDLVWVLTDAALEARSERHEKHPVEGGVVDIVYSSPAHLARTAANPGWWTHGLATAQVLLDKTGEVARVQAEIAAMPEERATTDVAEAFDGYLNGFYRSLKAWRRGDELAARMEAADSAAHLVRSLFALERRWAPYPSRLGGELPALAGQGWPDGYLERTLLELLRTGDPRLQQELEQRVEELLRARGFGHVVESWHGEIERVGAFRF